VNYRGGEERGNRVRIKGKKSIGRGRSRIETTTFGIICRQIRSATEETETLDHVTRVGFFGEGTPEVANRSLKESTSPAKFGCLGGGRKKFQNGETNRRSKAFRALPCALGKVEKQKRGEETLKKS